MEWTKKKKLWHKHTAKVFTLHNCVLFVWLESKHPSSKKNIGEVSYDFL